MEEHLAATTRKQADAALSRAQNVIYDAWERRTSRSQAALARKALANSPLCADTYNLLAEDTSGSSVPIGSGS